MIIRKTGNLVVCLVLFAEAFGLTFFIIQKRKLRANSAAQKPAVAPRLSKGEAVAQPELMNLSGQTVQLSQVTKKNALFVFVMSACTRCGEDAELWKALNKEAVSRNTNFYLISLDDNIETAKTFVSKYGITDLPILVDFNRQAALAFKAYIVPQYFLISSDGHLIEQWDGLRYLSASHLNSETLGSFFQSSPASRN